ncbi:ArsC family reductase [Stakelama tenebrarum]|uniref:ArsC family reductase n=1 Tax=Stakelama tenebrarum TaxID=2711215 RepID=A0A6G6Y8G4_9SPHN|nr:ArsC family reductase [Sphingosinithalassobacter tenebrarum]QIG81232.1 ArsC family reductase [Sphingosinithalassobacter tenebrarum]
MIKMYAIPNCDTVKKTRTWLDEHGVAYEFHDFKKEGVDPARLMHWIEQVGWETLLNKRGTTFRKLPDSDKQDLDADKAAALMIAQPSMIKRPVVEHPGGILVGFAAERYAAAFC